jgi:hypothetical protein
VKKLSLIVSGGLLGVVILLAAMICLDWLTSANQITFQVANDSNTVLHNVSVIIPGIPDTRMEEMQPTASFGPAIPARLKVALRVAFDANGQHYDYPIQVRALPFGLWTFWVHIDDRLQITVKRYGMFGA